MFELLFYSGMMCADADALVLRIQKNTSELSPKVVIELVETVKESVPECRYYWDANDWRNGSLFTLTLSVQWTHSISLKSKSIKLQHYMMLRLRWPHIVVLSMSANKVASRFMEPFAIVVTPITNDHGSITSSGTNIPWLCSIYRFTLRWNPPFT